MSFRSKLKEHMENLPAREVRRIVSKYNKELDIRGVSRMSKAAMIDAVQSKKPMDKTLLAKLTREAEKARGDKPVRKRAAKSGGGSKPDFLDLDKDGNKTESMKKAAADRKNKKK